MTTLATVSGIQARIFNLPNRPPLMIAADLAEIYGTTVRRIGEAVKRNPNRFPEDFMFRLSEVETEHLRSQNATAKTVSTKVRFEPLVFTHAGAYALSAVLKTPVAADISVIIHRAFAAMEAQALADVTHMLQKMQMELRYSRSTRGKIVDAGRNGWTFDQLKATVSYSRVKLTTMVKECVTLGLLAAPLADTPMELGPNLPDPNQMDMFRDV